MPHPRETRPQRGPISAAWLNELVRSLKETQDRHVEASLFERLAGGRVLAKIVGYDTASETYSWDEWRFYDGALEVKPGGLEGRIEGLDGWTDPTQFPAKEINGVSEVPAGAYVWLEPTAPTAEEGETPHPNYHFIAPTIPDAAYSVPGKISAGVAGSGALQYLGDGPKALEKLVLPNLDHPDHPDDHPEEYVDGDVILDTGLQTNMAAYEEDLGGGVIRVRQYDSSVETTARRSIALLDLEQATVHQKRTNWGTVADFGRMYAAEVRVATWYDTGSGSDPRGWVLGMRFEEAPDDDTFATSADAVSVINAATGPTGSIPFIVKTGYFIADRYATVTYSGGVGTPVAGASGSQSNAVGTWVNGILTSLVSSPDLSSGFTGTLPAANVGGFKAGSLAITATTVTR